MVVGELDMNVDPASTMQVADALIKARKDFDLLVVPGDGHGALRSTGAIDYGLRRQFDFFVRHLAGEATPDWNAVPASPPPAE
jgi:dipeptidyl aminopeptidase/acylaminoacyl peptidase